MALKSPIDKSSLHFQWIQSYDGPFPGNEGATNTEIELVLKKKNEVCAG